MIHIEAVSRVFGAGPTRTVALADVSLEIEQGEFVAVAGPSGSGKTSLLNIIGALDEPTGGTVRIDGKPLSGLSQDERARVRLETIGFVFQQFNLIPTLTIAENVAVPLLIAGVSRREAVGRGRELLDRVAIGDRWSALPSKLSGGQQQRVAIARSLIHNPRLIVCDEPTSSLDHETGRKVMELMREVAAGDGRSLVVVTHDSRIFEFADRIARMDDGRVVSVTEKV